MRDAFSIAISCQRLADRAVELNRELHIVLLNRSQFNSNARFQRHHARGNYSIIL